MSTFTDNEGKVWNITEPSKSNETGFQTNIPAAGKRAKWIGGTATSKEYGTIKVYGATWEPEETTTPPKPMSGNVFRGELQLVAVEQDYKNPRDYKEWGDAILVHCAVAMEKDADGVSHCPNARELTNCKKTKNWRGKESENCSTDEIKLKFQDIYFTWTPPATNVILKRNQLYDMNKPLGALLFHLAPDLWRAPFIKKAIIKAQGEAKTGGEKGREEEKQSVNLSVR